MQSRSLFRLLGVLTTLTPAVALMGCGDGSGPERIPGTPQAAQTGVLVNSAVSGAAWETSAGESGLTNSLGEFQYLPFQQVTFSVGSIVLGTVEGATFITPVELTGSASPVDQAALNQLVFLQSIDSDADHSNGISISDTTRSLADGLSLDFTDPDFASRVAEIVAAIAPGNAVVSESTALLNFYQTYAALGGTDTFSFGFPGFPPVGGGVTYELVFSDEFDEGTSPSPEKWNMETGYGPNGDGWGNNEWQLYTDSPDNVRVEDGNLVISALCPAPPCGVRDGTITSARLNTQDKFEFKFGTVVARIKPPVGDGAWPAFWSLGANFPEIGWPLSGEIDFMEMHNAFSNERTTHFTMHWDDQTAQAPAECSFNDGRVGTWDAERQLCWVFFTDNRGFAESLGEDFHIFEAEWDANQIVGKIDGITYFTRAIEPDTMEEFLEEFFLVLNVAMGGTLGSDNQPPNGNEVWPQTMLVDYVRVFQRIGDAGPAEDIVIDFENAPETYDFGPGGGFGGGAAAVVANPFPEGINPSAQVAQMLKFDVEPFGGATLALDSPANIAAGSVITMKVWSQRMVDVLFKFEGPVTSEVTVTHGGSGWEELSFDFGGFSGTAEAITVIFDNGINGDAANDPDNWTFYFDDIVIPVGGAPPDDDPGGVIADFEGPPESYDFGPDAGFAGGVAFVVSNPFPEGINTSAQVAIMQKFTAEVFGGATLMLPTPLEVPAGSSFTMKVWSPREVDVLFKLEGPVESEINLTHGGTGWEELVYDFSAFSGTVTGITIIFDLGILGDAGGDPDNWTFYFDDITLVTNLGGGGGGGGDPGAFFADFEGAPESYDFGVDGGFGGGAAAVIANPVPGGLNTSAQVVRMLKFDVEPFGGATLMLPTPLDVPAGSSFTMLVWSQRVVDVLFKLEGPVEAEVTVVHGGTGWELLTFDFPGFSGTVEGITVIFDNGINGDAAGDPENWTFYFDDITLVPPGGGGDPGDDLSQIDLPITFDDPTVDYTVTDFGDPVSVVTTLVSDPDDAANTVASTTKPLGAPEWAGTTMSTSEGFATAIPFTASETTIGIRVYSPDAGIPVRLKAEDQVGGAISVETEAMTTVANEWETLVFDFANEVEGDPLDLGTAYFALSVFFNFGTDGDTAGEKTYLWDDVEFGVPAPDVTPPTLTTVNIASSNANPAFAAVGDVVTVTLTADEPIMMPTVTIGGVVADVTAAGANWEASRTMTDTDVEGPVEFSVEFSDLAGNAGVPVSMTTDGSGVTLDATAPTVEIQGAPGTFETLDPIGLTFQFSEAVTGFAVNDIQTTNGSPSMLVMVDGDTYTANVTPNGIGDLTIAVAAGAAMDSAGNLSEMAADVTVVNELDEEAPLLTFIGISSSNANDMYARTGDVVTIDMTADEDILAPTVTIAGAPADSVDGAGTMWQASRTMLATDPEGQIEFVINFEDLGGNPGPQSTVTTDGSSVTFDITAPTLAIEGTPAAIETLDPITVTFQFNEDVSDFAVGDIDVTNGAAAGFVSVDEATYTADITPDGNGDLTITVAADAAADLAGNGNEMASVTIPLDLQPVWNLVWSDDFDGGALDGAKWTARTDEDCPAPCDGVQEYITERVAVAGGVLTIEARDEGARYTSGLIDTRGKELDFKHGRIEIDARMPGTLGTAPSLWMLPATDAYGPWPLSGEIDIANAPDLGVGGNKTLEHTLRYGLPVPEDTATTGTYDAPTAPDLAFLTYALEWEEGEIRWFVDDVHVVTQTEDNWYAYFPDADGVYTLGTGAAPFDENFYLLIGLAITDSAGGNSVFPQTLEIDAVRVYECANAIDPEAGTGCSTGDPGVLPIEAPDAPYTEMLEVYTDAPAVLSFETVGPDVTNSLATGISDDPAGQVVLTSDPAFVDGANILWRVHIAAIDPGYRGEVFMASEDLTAHPILATGFDLVGGETAGELLFDMRVNSATPGTQLMARLDSEPGNAGEVVLPLPPDDAWRTYSVKIAELLANPLGGGSGLDPSNVVDLFVIEATDGTVELDVDNIRVKVACRDDGGCQATARFKTEDYVQDFDSLDQGSPTALSDDGWLVFGNVYDSGGVFKFGYGAFPAPNDGANFSAVVSGQGGADQGSQQLSIFSDYSCCQPDEGHFNGTDLVESIVFRERTITADDVGKMLWFSFDAKLGNLEGATTANAFIKTLDPNAGFQTTNFVPVDTTAIPPTWARYSVSLEIDAGLEGQLLQVGFSSTASNFEGSGVFYDNIQVRTGPTAP